MKKIYQFLSSVKLAIVLFLILAFFSIFGTIIPQGRLESFYLMKYGKTIGNIILKLQLNDAYHSWWYIITLFLFLINLIICSLKRFPISLRLYKTDPTNVDPENFPNQIKLNLKKEFNSVVNFLLKKLGFKEIKKISNGILFYKDLNRKAFFSVYFVHFSMVLILIGGLIGAIWGYRGNMIILEGQISNRVRPFRGEEPIFLDFALKLNKFTLELYPNGIPKEYISNVTVIDGNKRINAIIKVNHPFKYKGISFYQASYNEIPKFILYIKEKNKTYELTSMVPINVDNYSIFLDKYMRHYGFILIYITVFDQNTGKQYSTYLVKGIPNILKLGEKEYHINVKKMEVIYLTGLQVKKDPGIILVYSGFILMILGLFWVYFFDPKTFWIFVKQKNKEIEVILGARAKREKEGLKLKLEELAKKIQKEV